MDVTTQRGVFAAIYLALFSGSFIVHGAGQIVDNLIPGFFLSPWSVLLNGSLFIAAGISHFTIKEVT